MTNNQSALCEGAQSVLDLIRAGQPLTRTQIHTIEGLCASYANLCEVQTLATARADKLQIQLNDWHEIATIRSNRIEELETTIAQLRLNLAEAEQMFEGEHAQRKHLQGELSRTQAAHHALLSGAA